MGISKGHVVATDTPTTLHLILSVIPPPPHRPNCGKRVTEHRLILQRVMFPDSQHQTTREVCLNQSSVATPMRRHQWTALRPTHQPRPGSAGPAYPRRPTPAAVLARRAWRGPLDHSVYLAISSQPQTSLKYPSQKRVHQTSPSLSLSCQPRRALRMQRNAVGRYPVWPPLPPPVAHL